jgi:peptidyl-prolyl cis-trans isomerase B (cyclophilin B)
MAQVTNTVDYTKKRAIIETNKGAITLKFFPDVAPNHVKNFIDLAEKGFYNGTIFHRVIKGFMIQGGDPTGTGTGGPGYTIKAEFNARLHNPGTLSMARTNDPNSAGSQFFICLERQSSLDRKYTVFGEVETGLEVVKAIGDTRCDARDRPVEEVKMKSVRVTEGAGK